MEDNKPNARIMSVFKYIDEGFKIVKLKFPTEITPTVGMILKDINDISYTISGIVFENTSDGTWDCKLNDSLNKLILESELYIT